MKIQIQMKDKIKIIILAAGKGTRMKSEEPKALAMLKGKPFLAHILDTIKKLDENIEPIIVVGYKQERIKEVLGENYAYAEQKEQLGTGHAVMSAKEKANETPHDMILILSTDQPVVSTQTLENIIDTHIKTQATLTLGTAIVPDYEDWRIALYSHFGRVVRDQNGKVQKLVEFKNTTDEEKNIKEVNPAIYIFNAEWLWNNIDKIEMNPVRNEYLFTDIINIAFSQNKNIEAVPISSLLEALQPNSQEELAILEKLMDN